jgi:branched-chain amino acid transport system ATP-binding protein
VTSHRLRIQNLVVYRDSRRVLDGITVEVGAQEVVGIVGPNGAGKSTLLRAISGLHRPRSGLIQYGSQTLNGLAPERVVQAGVAHVPEGRQVFPRLTVMENLQMGAFTRAHKMTERADAILQKFVQLRDRRHQLAGSLSGGEQQMLAIARALMSAPQLLMIDEPSLGLSIAAIDALEQTLRELRAEGLQMLLVEQNIRLAQALAMRTYVLSGGKIFASGETSAILSAGDFASTYFGTVAKELE